MLYNELDMVEGLAQDSDLRPKACQALWLAYEVEEIHTPLLIKAGIVIDSKQVSDGRCFSRPLKEGYLEAVGRMKSRVTKPFGIYRITPWGKERLDQVRVEVYKRRRLQLMAIQEEVGRS